MRGVWQHGYDDVALSAIALAVEAVSAPAAITSAMLLGYGQQPPASNLLSEGFYYWFTHNPQANKTNFHSHINHSLVAVVVIF